jgi:predicted acylesterase/phospholipase RssA
VLTVRGAGPLGQTMGVRWREMAGFIRAAFSNAVSRRRLAASMERVVFHDRRDDSAWLREDFDAFASHFVGLSEANLRDALLASGSIPLVLEAVTGIAGAPDGAYWDGGLIDYHLHLPYQRDPGLVLYPHFTDHIVPGWLDKSMPWRRARDAALDNVVLISPSPSFLAALPHGKMPDRGDFKVYGQDHAGRTRDWNRAIGESERLADAFARWCEKPDLKQAVAF